MPGDEPLKIALYNAFASTDCSNLQGLDSRMLPSIAAACGVDGILSRIDRSSAMIELICAPPIDADSCLSWIDTYQITAP
jgi:hypothetical protein